MENFRKPNFELVADILYWMVKLYDPETTLSDRVEFENERVEFLTGIAGLMATKARLKLNTKKLYASDGRAVQELLKLASLLYKATSTAAKKFEEEGVPPPIKMQEVKTARQLASDITQSGATLYDLMENEADDRVERARALRFLDLAASTSDGPREQQYIERSIRDVIDSTKQGLEDSRKECEELEADERNLESKILKKSEELERTEKRLKSLENVRPQFMEEAEKLEKELQRYYEVYMDKHRNLDYLEFELDKYKRSEEERMAEHERKLRKMRERLLREEVDLLRGGREDSETKTQGGEARRDYYGGGGGGGGGGSG
jgi:clusterin-associated protein 1